MEDNPRSVNISFKNLVQRDDIPCGVYLSTVDHERFMVNSPNRDVKRMIDKMIYSVWLIESTYPRRYAVFG